MTMHSRQCLEGFAGGVLSALSVSLVLALILVSRSDVTTATEFIEDVGAIRPDQISYGCVDAPVNFPNGVTITELQATVYDNDLLFGVEVSLRRVNNFTGDFVRLASVGTAGPAAFGGVQVLQTSVIHEPVVYYPDYAYYATTCLRSTDIHLYSVRFYFQGAADAADVPIVVPAAAFSSDGYWPETHHFWFDGGYLEGAFNTLMVHLPLAIK
jgi:hypothetical protein